MIHDKDAQDCLKSCWLCGVQVGFGINVAAYRWGVDVRPDGIQARYCYDCAELMSETEEIIEDGQD